jgi:hypothetical protein
MVYQKRGSKVRALFDQNNLLRKEQPIQNTIKQAWFWLRRCAALVASENHSKMRHRHQIFPNIACIFSFHHQPQVERKLMTKEIKIHQVLVLRSSFAPKTSPYKTRSASKSVTVITR